MGNIGEAKFLCKCVELGIPIYSSLEITNVVILLLIVIINYYEFR